MQYTSLGALPEEFESPMGLATNGWASVSYTANFSVGDTDIGEGQPG